MTETAPTSHRPLLALATLLALGCGSAQMDAGGGDLRDASGVHQSKAARSVERPMLVEWPAVEKAALQTAANRGVVVVRYDGVRLKLLDGCTAGGSYGFEATARSTDGFEIADRTALEAKLPLGAVGLKGEIEAGNTLALSYVAVGTKSAGAAVLAAGIEGDCAGATHFVRSMVVGAYELSSGRKRGGGASVEVGSAGVGGVHEEERRVIRRDGDLARCADQTTPAGDPACQAIVQLVLEPLGSGEKEAAVPEPPGGSGGHAAPPAKAAGVPAVLDEELVRQAGTGLRWLRCAVGTTWSGKGCPGLAERMSWDEAQGACPAGLRLPTRDELAGLLDGCDLLVRKGENGSCRRCADSPACAAVFGSSSIREGAYWSSTARDEHSAAYVSFKQGSVARTSRGNAFSVLCVAK